MTRPPGAAIPRYWSPWRWAPAARRRWAIQWTLNALDPIGYTGA